MDTVWGELTVFFEDPFWVGVFTRTEAGRLSACKVTFGAEPKVGEVWDLVCKNYRRLVFSPAVDAAAKPAPSNPKRARRAARKQMGQRGVGTKSQQALQRQREEGKLQRHMLGKVQKEAEKARQFALKQQKRKEKHRGR